MIYTIFALVLVITLISGFMVGKKITMRKIYNNLSKGTGRMGIIRVSDSWSNIRGVIEVEEMETAGENTKVIIHKAIADRDSSSKSESEILKKWGGNDWVKTSSITWYNSNSQKIRDAKLKSILNES